MSPELTPQEEAFERGLKDEIKKLILAVYEVRYAGRGGYRETPREVPEEICDLILDQIVCEQALGLHPRPRNEHEFRLLALAVVHRYLPGPTAD